MFKKIDDIKKEKIKDEFVAGFEVPIKEDNKDEFDKIIADAIKESEEKEVKVNDECCFKVRDKLHDIHEISVKNNHLLSNLNKIFIVVFLAGTAFGMSDNKWLPYASMLWEFGKDILTKG